MTDETPSPSLLSQYESHIVTLNVCRIVPWARIRNTRQKYFNKLVKSIMERNFTSFSFVVVCRIPQASPNYAGAVAEYSNFISKIEPSKLNNNKPTDYTEENSYFGIIDGCHRITALKQVLLSGKNHDINLYIKCILLDNCPESDAVHLAKDLNEQSSTVIVPTLLNYVEYVGRSSNFFPQEIDGNDVAQVMKAYKEGRITKFNMKTINFKVLYKLWRVRIYFFRGTFPFDI